VRFPPGKPLGRLIYTFPWCYRRQYYSILLLHRVFCVPQAHRVRSKDRSKRIKTRDYDTRRRDSFLRDPSRPSTTLHRVGKHAYYHRAAADMGKGRVLLLVVEAPPGGPTDSTTLLPYAQKRTLPAGHTRAIHLITAVGGRSSTAALEGEMRRLVPSTQQGL
jgi:hypothetical protein